MPNEVKPERLLVLVAHGSRDPRWRAPFESLIQAMQDELGANKPVKLAYMEMAEPDLQTVVKQALEAQPSLNTVVVWPMLMAAGAHFSTDIQEQTAALRHEFSGLNVELLPPVGEHPAMRKLLVYLAEEAVEGTLMQEADTETEANDEAE
jgi:sirohydrochlorin cobaltochelatase